MSITYPEAIVVGLLQGVSELFPVSSLGHSVLIPALIGGRWARDLSVSAPESPYLAYIVGLHVATALALVVYFWRDWIRIVGGLLTSLRHRRIETPDERLAWMIVVATIPVGLAGLLLEHTFRTVLGRPIPAAIFLMINGVILYGAERLRRRSAVIVVAATAVDPVAVEATGMTADPIAVDSAGGSTDAVDLAEVVESGYAAPGISDDEPEQDSAASDARIAGRSFADSTLIGSAQILALLPGISRSGVAMSAGLLRGLHHDDAARFSFLLATPVILAAGVLKLPDLTGPLGAGIGGQVLAGSLASGIAAYLSVRFLMRYFQTRTLTPFAIYCAVAGLASLAWLTMR